MARIRTIKPEFFKNDQLAELPAMVRLLFIGLWCQADKAGKLEDRPKRLKVEIFPYDNIDVDKALDLLVGAGLILRYKVNANSDARILAPEQPITQVGYIKILTFLKHQNPNSKEAESKIPDPEWYRHSESTVLAQCKDGASITGKEGKGKEKERKGEYAREVELEDSILKYFGFNAIANPDKQRLIFEFCSALFNSDRLEFFRKQFNDYVEFKNLNGGYKHSFQKFLGDQSERFENGAWNAENWSHKLDEEKKKHATSSGASAEFPDHYSRTFASKLDVPKLMEYNRHLRSLGFQPVKDRMQNVVDWIKQKTA